MNQKTYLILVIAAVGLLLYFGSTANIIGGEISGQCQDTDGGDVPLVAGEVKGNAGAGMPFNRAAKDECHLNNTQLWERVCVQAQWAQEKKEYNSGWSWSTIKHDCDCVTPDGYEMPAYCAGGTAPTTTLPDTPTTTEYTPIDEDNPLLGPLFFGGMILVLGYLFLGRKTA